jgi:pimeloyl-ACP methyl ester carboxylesterase
MCAAACSAHVNSVAHMNVPRFTPLHRGGTGPPLVCLHGFADTWRSWDLVLGQLERHHDVLAPTLPGHAGGRPLGGVPDSSLIPDAIEAAMDAAGLSTAHLVGNSLGAYVALQLAARGRAESVVAFAPAGGWSDGDPSRAQLLGLQRMMHEQLKAAAPYADAIVSTPQGRRRVTALITTNFEHIPADLLVHQIWGAAMCDARPLLDYADGAAWQLDAEHITCPVRIVWGSDDKLLPWPAAASRFAEDWLPGADWIELEGVGHCPQLDVPLEAAQMILGFTVR